MNMIKRILLILTVFFMFNLSVEANILPASTDDISSFAIGMYQMPKNIIVYSKPNFNSTVLYRANWDYETFNSSKGVEADIFTVFIQQKELAYAQVTDYVEDWVEIIYCKKPLKKGWVKSEDLRFMLWRNFYNTYGRKYGLFIMSDAPKTVKDLHSGSNEDSQVMQSLVSPQKIKFTVIKGNWALVTAIENNMGKTGYMRWRSDNGEIYAFPAIK